MNDNELQEIVRKLQMLEQENQRLKTAMQSGNADQLVVTEGDFQGLPVLTFRQGDKRPFNLGVRKLKLIKQAMPIIEDFLRKHDEKGNGPKKNDAKKKNTKGGFAPSACSDFDQI